MPRQLFLAAYDVRIKDPGGPRRLRLALKIVRNYATGGQKSVHEVWLDHDEKEQLLRQMSDVLNLKRDRFFLLRLDPRSTPALLGRAVSPQDGALYMVA